MRYTLATTTVLVAIAAAAAPPPEICLSRPTLDTANDFLGDVSLQQVATTATVPTGFYQTFSNFRGSTSSTKYLTYVELDTYDTNACANKCDAVGGCNGFNIYFERAPLTAPTQQCPNPPSKTLIKCVLWGGPVVAANAVNSGQYAYDYHVVITGSNGYQATQNTGAKDLTALGYCSPPAFFGDAAIEAPPASYLGVRTMSTSVLDAELCAAECKKLNDFVKAQLSSSSGPPVFCNFFNVYLELRDAELQHQACTLYSQKFGASSATNYGGPRSGELFTITSSYGYTAIMGGQC